MVLLQYLSIKDFIFLEAPWTGKTLLCLRSPCRSLTVLIVLINLISSLYKRGGTQFFITILPASMTVKVKSASHYDWHILGSLPSQYCAIKGKTFMFFLIKYTVYLSGLWEEDLRAQEKRVKLWAYHFFQSPQIHCCLISESWWHRRAKKL